MMAGRTFLSRAIAPFVLFGLVAASRLLFLAPGPCEWDSFLFSGGVVRFDLAEQRPHPPGYPLLIVLARAVRLVALDPTSSLVFVSATLGSLVFFPLRRVMRMFLPEPLGTAATLLVLMSPGHWMTSERALSDTPGFFFAIWALDLALRARARQGKDPARGTGWILIAAAVVAGLGAGVRPQGLLVLAPLAVAVMRERGPRAWRRPAAAFALAVLAWLAPAIQSAGGLIPFADILGRHGENFVRDDSLLANFSFPRLAGWVAGATLRGWGPPALGWTIAALGILGLATRRERLWPAVQPPLGLSAVLEAFLPYYLFLLFFMLAPLVRYSLVATPLFAILSIRGAIAALGPIARERAGRAALAAVLAATALEVGWTVPPLRILHGSLPPSEQLARYIFDHTSPARTTIWHHPYLAAPFRDRLAGWDLKRIGGADPGDEKAIVLEATVGPDTPDGALACFEWKDSRLLQLVQVESTRACVAARGDANAPGGRSAATSLQRSPPYV